MSDTSGINDVLTSFIADGYVFGSSVASEVSDNIRKLVAKTNLREEQYVIIERFNNINIYVTDLAKIIIYSTKSDLQYFDLDFSIPQKYLFVVKKSMLVSANCYNRINTDEKLSESLIPIVATQLWDLLSNIKEYSKIEK